MTESNVVEFGPDVAHIKWDNNVVADTISCLPTSEMNAAEYEYFTSEEDEAEFPLDLYLIREQTSQDLTEVNSALNKLVNDKKIQIEHKYN